MEKTYKDIKIFRYKVTVWDSIEERNKEEYGFVAGLTIGDAVDRVESIYMHYDENYSDMEDIYIYEVDSYDCGVLTEETIKETMENN